MRAIQTNISFPRQGGMPLQHQQQLGFRTTHEDDRKFYMRRDPGPPNGN
jgi:hypothetical protein